MTLDKTSAAEALAEIGQSQRRSANLYGYSQGAPYMFLTGLMWLVADEVFYFVPAAQEWIWPLASLLSAPIYIAIAVLQARGRTRAASAGKLDSHFWKGIGIWLIVLAFVAGTFTVFGSVNGVKVHSFIGLLTGLAYAALGLWLGARILITGLAIAGLTMVCHLFTNDAYTLFMGVVGGGGMMLAAWWLRRV